MRSALFWQRALDLRAPEGLAAAGLARCRMVVLWGLTVESWATLL